MTRTAARYVQSREAVGDRSSSRRNVHESIDNTVSVSCRQQNITRIYDYNDNEDVLSVVLEESMDRLGNTPRCSTSS